MKTLQQSIMRFLLFGFLISFPFLLYSESNKDMKQQFDSIAQKLNMVSFSNNGEARLLLAELCHIAKSSKQDHDLFTAKCLYWETVINSSHRKNDSTLLEKTKESLNILNDRSFPFENALLHYTLSLSYTTRGDYAEAFSIALQTLEQFKRMNDSIFIAKSFILLGNICNYIKSYNMANDYYRNAFPFVTPEQFEYYQLHLNTYRILFFTKQVDTSIDSLILFLPKLKSFNNKGLLAIFYLNLGACYSAKGASEDAFRCYNIVLNDLLQDIDNESIKFALYQNLGSYYLKNKDFEKAAQYFDSAKYTAIKEDNSEQLQYSFLGLSDLYEQKNNADSAFFYLKQYYHLNNDATNNSKAIEAYQAYASVLLDTSQKELIIAEQELELKNRRFMITITLLVTIILLIILFLIVLQQKRRIKESENRELSKQLEHEKKIQQLQKEQLESKVREITSFSLLLSGKNNNLQQIAGILESAKNQADFEDAKKEVLHLIKNNLNTDNDWNMFMLHFDKVHPQFFERLKRRCGELTEHNLRLCAYFRIGISVKEISQFLNVTPDSVIVYRYRLKKKMGLKEDDNLDDFIRNI